MDFKTIQALTADDMAKVNETIQAQLNSDVSLINQLGFYIVSGGGKRLRPLLAILSARALGYQGNGHTMAAAFIEFIHTATLLHDDVVDESDMRRGKATANAAFGKAASVLVGDFIYTRSFQMMTELGSMKILKLMSNAVNVIAEGEVMQLAFAKNTATTEDEYLQVVRGKTAALFAAACEVGPIIANKGKAEQSACRSYGTNLGIAFQLIDDALDYGGVASKLGKNTGDDFREGKITLPVVLSYRRGNDSERAFWKRALEEGQHGDAELAEAMTIMKKHRAIEDTIERARHYGAMARDALAIFADTPMKRSMVEAVDFCISRAH